MDIQSVGQKVLISLPQYHNRRRLISRQLGGFGISDLKYVMPMPLDDIDLKLRMRYDKKSIALLSQIITLSEIFKKFVASGSRDILILEDDIVFHPELPTKLKSVDLPNDWVFFYLGGAVCEKAFRVSDDLLRSKRVMDLHAVVIKGAIVPCLLSKFQEVMQNHAGKRSVTPADVLISEFHHAHPAYICRPNLVWQDEHFSDLQGRVYSNYDPDGVHKYEKYEIVDSLDEL